MEHRNAIDSMAAERYIIGEMNGEERDAFEEHYFDCPECAMSVRGAVKVAATVRLGDPHGASLAPRRMNWWAAACIVLAGGLGWQNFVLPRIARQSDQTHVLNVQVIPGQSIPAASRGAERQYKVVDVQAGEPVHLDVPFTPEDVSGPYRGQIYDKQGRPVGNAFDVPPPPENASVAIFVPAGTLPSGNCTLVIRSAGGQEVSEYRFEVRAR